MSVAASPPITREHRRVLLASTVGTTIEWYDFFIYAVSSGLVFATQFFGGLGKDALILSFATVGVSFFFRPIGAIIAGHLGDRIGRRPLLVLTLILMGVATALMGLLPSTASIGVAAPILLVLLRVLQGLSAGGEWGGAAMLAVEHAPANRRGLYGAFPQIGVPIGLLLANGTLALVTATMTSAQFLAWGWRIPFLLSVVLIAVGLLIRVGISESPVFDEVLEAGERKSVPLAALLRTHWLYVILGALLFAATSAAGYMTAGGYVQSYAVTVLKLDRTLILLAVMVSSLGWLATALLAGWLSDKYGRLRVFQLGFLIQLAWLFPFFALLNTRNVGLIILSLLIFTVGLGLTYGPQAALYAEMFPAPVRYSGASLAYGLGSVVGGAFAPTIAVALQTATGTVYAVAAYLAVVTLVSLTVTFLIKEPKGLPLNLAGPVVEPATATPSTT
jgi:MFS family permease